MRVVLQLHCPGGGFFQEMSLKPQVGPIFSYFRFFVFQVLFVFQARKGVILIWRSVKVKNFEV